MKKNKKMYLLIFIVFIVIIVLFKINLGLRYNLGITDYIKYSEPISDYERDFLTKRPLLVGVYTYPPFSYTNQYNHLNSGIFVDYLSQLSIEMRHDVVLKANSQKNLENALMSNEINAMMFKKRDKGITQFSLSQPLATINGKLLVKNSKAVNKIFDLKGKAIVAIKRHCVLDVIDKELFSDNQIEIIEVDNMYQCFALIKNGTAEGYIGDDIEVLHFINVTNKGSFYKFLDEIFYQNDIVIAVKQDNQVLLNLVNKAILILKKKNLIIQTQYKWLGDVDIEGIDLKQLDLIYKMILGVVFIIGFFSIWNYLITKKVNEKTKELLESKQELRLIIDTMHSGIIVVNNEGLIIECNSIIANMLNCSREDLLQSEYKSIDKLQSFFNIQQHITTARIDNSYYNIINISIANNKRMLIVEDYTEKHIKEKQARQESKMIAVGQLSAGLAHEIRNPLGLIKSYSYVIKKHCNEDITKHAHFVINDSVARINGLIENLLRYSRLSSEIDKVVNIKELLAMIIALEQKNLEANAIQLQINIDIDASYKIITNEDMLKMIFLNLLNNSIDAFKNSEQVARLIIIKAELLADNLLVSIKDNGCGIEPDYLENIFNPFYSTKESGTGLGLYLISAEITNKEGSINVHSELGEGTVFEISLPVTVG